MKIKTKDFIIRLFYIIPFLLFAYTLIKELFLVDERFKQINFAVISATMIFLYQSIRNSIIGWILAMFLYLIFLYFLGEGVIRSIEYLGAKIDMKTFIIQCILTLIYLGLGFLYWKIRPTKRLI